MIRDICFETYDLIDVKKDACLEYTKVLSVDLSGDGSAVHVILFALNGYVGIYKDNKLCLENDGIGLSSAIAGDVLVGINGGTIIVRLYCNGMLSMSTLKTTADGDLIMSGTQTFDFFPRNATCMKHFRLSDGSLVLAVSSESKCEFHKYDYKLQNFEKELDVALDSDVNSFDFVNGSILLIGLASGGILVFEVNSDTENDPENNPKDTIDSLAAGGSTNTRRTIKLRKVEVQCGYEPPLPRSHASRTFAESVARGYSVSSAHTNRSRPGRDAGELSAVSESSSRFSTFHFAAAWADGRICLCDIIPLPSPREDTNTASDVSPTYTWKVSRCIQTGLCLFNIECIDLIKTVGDSSFVHGVLCVAIARSGQTFFVSTTDFSDTCALESVSELPSTICCFESSTLLNDSGRIPRTKDHATLSKDDVRITFASESAILIRDFTIGYNPIVAARLISANMLEHENIPAIEQRQASFSSIHNPQNIVNVAVTNLESSMVTSESFRIDSGKTFEGRRSSSSSSPNFVEVNRSEPFTDSYVSDMRLLYLTGDGNVMSIPHIRTQFLKFGAGCVKTRISAEDMECIKDSLVRWSIEPDLEESEISDLVLEYFKDVTDVLRSVIHGGLDPTSVINNKSIADHMALYISHELSLMSHSDLYNFKEDLKRLSVDF